MLRLESVERVLVLGDLSSTSNEARDALFAVLGPKILRGEGTGEEAIALIAGLYGKKVEIIQAEGAEQIVVETSDATDERTLDPEIQTALLLKLKGRFEANMSRHEGIQWVDVQSSLEADLGKLWSLQQMETAGHVPDVYREDGGAYYLGTCSEETPAGEGQRNIVYDAEAQALLQEGIICNGNAVDIVAAMGIDLMDETQYRHLQTLGNFDVQTWSWLKAPDAMRKSGDALYGCRQDEGVFVYQDDADYHLNYGGVRGWLRVSKA